MTDEHIAPDPDETAAEAAEPEPVTVADLNSALLEMLLDTEINLDDHVVLQDEYGAESHIREIAVVNGILFLIPTRPFDLEDDDAAFLPEEDDH
jgi:hypothetical protein